MSTASDLAYTDHWAHLSAELDRLDGLLRALIETARSRYPPPAAGADAGWGHGIFVGDDEIDAILGRGESERDPDELRREIARAADASATARVSLPLAWLAQTFELSRWELDVVLLCLAPELDPAYERVFGYLADDLTKPRPTVALALDLLGDDPALRARGRQALGEAAPLRRYGLVTFVEESGAHRPARLLKLDDRICDLLLGNAAAPARPWLRVVTPNAAPAVGAAAQIVAAAAPALLGAGRDGRVVVSLHGGAAPERRAFAEEVAGALGTPIVVVELPVLVAAETPFEPALREAVREGLIQSAPVLLEGAHELAEQQAQAALRLRQLGDVVDQLASVAFVSAPHPLRAAPHADWPWVDVEVPEPDLGRRSERWRAALAAAGVAIGGPEADSLAGRYRLAPTEIDAVVATARAAAALRGVDGPLDLRDVDGASRAAAATVLTGLARRVTPRYGWTDIVLPQRELRRLHEIAAAVTSRRRVLADWGFGLKHTRGMGLAALFSGPPGTGKTMAAEILAGELGLDLYTIDLAGVVSKYIGETEKNLSRIFDAAESTSALLFFDEADALFGKRSEVKDAHDRYANIEVAYLLQRIEDYTGLAVLATNLRRNLDDAFLRRLHFVVEFPFPDPAERLRLWRGLVPPEAELDDGVDWPFLAELALAGGSIKSAVLHAAYQAAAADRAIGMADLLLGARRELDKAGRLTKPSDFGSHAHLLPDDA